MAAQCVWPSPIINTRHLSPLTHHLWLVNMKTQNSESAVWTFWHHVKSMQTRLPCCFKTTMSFSLIKWPNNKTAYHNGLHNHRPSSVEKHCLIMLWSSFYSKSGQQVFLRVSSTWFTLVCRHPVVDPIIVAIFSDATADAHFYFTYSRGKHHLNVLCEKIHTHKKLLSFQLSCSPTSYTYCSSITIEGWNSTQEHSTSAVTDRSAVKWLYWPPHLTCLDSLRQSTQSTSCPGQEIQQQKKKRKTGRGTGPRTEINAAHPDKNIFKTNPNHRAHTYWYNPFHTPLPQHPCFNVGNQQHTFFPYSHTDSSAYSFIFFNYWGRWGMREKMGPGFPEGLLSLLLSPAIVNL